MKGGEEKVDAAQEGVSSSQDALGRHIDLGGDQLSVWCLGQGHPTVVLEAGLGDTCESWTPIQTALSQFALVCSYDRAGLGRSDPGPPPRTGLRCAQELRAWLQRAQLPPPYVLVGHSFGGLIVQLFASHYAQEVAGIVLVDSAHAEQEAWLQAELSPEEMAEQLRFQSGENAERMDLSTSFDELRAAEFHPDVPLIVLVRGTMPPEEEPPNWTAERAARMEPAWRNLQAQLAHRSPQGQLVIAEQSGHYIQRAQPELIIAAIREVLALTHQ